MRKTRTPSACPNQRETLWGFGYLAIQLLVLPGLLTWGNGCLAHPLSMAELNFVFSACPNQRETLWGFGYLAIQLLVLPGLLTWGNGCLAHPLSMAELNFVFYFLNFLAILVIFHDFFRRSFAPVRQHPAYFCQAVVLGLVAYYASSLAVNWILRQLAPGFSNYNDQSIAALGQGSFLLTAIGTVILGPSPPWARAASCSPPSAQ